MLVSHAFPRRHFLALKFAALFAAVAKVATTASVTARELRLSSCAGLASSVSIVSGPVVVVGISCSGSAGRTRARGGCV